MASLGAVEAVSLGGSGARVTGVSQEKGAGQGRRGPRRTGKCRALGVVAWEAWAWPWEAGRSGIGGCADGAGCPLCLSEVRAVASAREAAAGTVSRGAGSTGSLCPRGGGAGTLHAAGRFPRAPPALSRRTPSPRPTLASAGPSPPRFRERRALPSGWSSTPRAPASRGARGRAGVAGPLSAGVALNVPAALESLWEKCFLPSSPPASIFHRGSFPGYFVKALFRERDQPFPESAGVCLLEACRGASAGDGVPPFQPSLRCALPLAFPFSSARFFNLRVFSNCHLTPVMVFSSVLRWKISSV